MTCPDVKRRRVKATAIGIRAFSLVSDQTSVGKMHSVFNRAFNILTPTQELVTVTSRDNKSPWTINVDMEESFPDVGIREGMNVDKKGSCLTLSEAERFVCLKKARVWSYLRKMGEPPPTILGVRDNLDRVTSFFAVLEK